MFECIVVHSTVALAVLQGRYRGEGFIVDLGFDVEYEDPLFYSFEVTIEKDKSYESYIKITVSYAYSYAR